MSDKQATDGQIVDLATELLQWLQQKCGSAHAAGVVCSMVLHEIAGPEGSYTYIDSAKKAAAAGAYTLTPPEGEGNEDRTRDHSDVAPGSQG